VGVVEQDGGDRIAEPTLCFYHISQILMRWFVVIQQGSGRSHGVCVGRNGRTEIDVPIIFVVGRKLEFDFAG
jgi:hypothetical protein